jgi:hypothetical protein
MPRRGRNPHMLEGKNPYTIRQGGRSVLHHRCLNAADAILYVAWTDRVGRAAFIGV